jgi:phosphoribosyl-AMP cyclohydrolase
MSKFVSSPLCSQPSSRAMDMDEASSDKKALEEGAAFTPRFSPDGLIACVTVDESSGEVLMLAHMNREALDKTLASRIMHYWSRSRGTLWRKGDTSGQVQTLVELRVDCDQDALLARVQVGGDGGACHTGRRSCFYRRVEADEGGARLVTTM